ncbi:fatty acyl-AMP ligase [Mangrovicella endophytica]|uniref:fatty acyl-AMP ligase n=1 Tax=Mangrovicella endophytica TaxID=2066697 RepID=UPI000C9E9BED|nr:fatty acyl-AMP ligase [Mangrovicella endophytica]
MAPAQPIAARLQHFARVQPDRTALIVLGNGEAESERASFGDIDEGAHRVAAQLVEAGLAGRAVLLPARSDRGFVEAFFGCLYAGAIAVPVPHGAKNRDFERIDGIARDAGAAVIFGHTPSAVAELHGLTWMEPVSKEGAAPAAPPPPDGDAVAFLQYTSGSTGNPKGAVITQRALAANLRMLGEAFAVRPDSRFLTWVPLFHDMGLSQILLPLTSGVECVLMPPLAFMQRPLRWLQAISRHRVTISGAPNFAFELCARRAVPAISGDLDLSYWTTAFCAAEPVRASTMRRFADAFAPAGFDAGALFPCYGAAEATVFISGGTAGSGVTTLPAEATPAGMGELVSCGRSFGGSSLAVVDPSSRAPLPDGQVGEIWVAGEHLASGYWHNPETSAATFGAGLAPAADGPYWRSGDLGLVRDGNLYVAGRLKALIIHRGVNHHPEDIETSIAASHADFGTAGAVFSVDTGEEEQVVAVCEVARASMAQLDAPAMIDRALDAVAITHGFRLHDLVLVRPNSIARTTSGKVRRDACREEYLKGELRLAPYLPGHKQLGRYAA